MQQRMLDGLFEAFGDPRMQDLVDEFCTLRGTIAPVNVDTLRTSIDSLLTTIVVVLNDQHALFLVEGDTTQDISGGNSCRERCPTQRGGDSLCVKRQGVYFGVRNAVCCTERVCAKNRFPFPDAVVVLHLLRVKLQWGEDDQKRDPLSVLTRLDEFLALLGMQSVSVAELWQNANSLSGEHQAQLWTAVSNLLNASVVKGL